jgi:hypothetical protein
MPFSVEYEEIGFPAGQFTDDRAGAFLAGDLQFNNPVGLNLTDFVESGSLDVGSEKLAEGGRCWRVEMGTGGEVEPWDIWFAGE